MSPGPNFPYPGVFRTGMLGAHPPQEQALAAVAGKCDDTVSVVESLETKSSMSGSDVSTKSPPKPLPILLVIVMFLMIVASGGGLCLSALQFRPSKKGERDCLSQSFILFASMISPMYVALHIFVSFRNYQVVRRQSLQSPLVSWAFIVARLGLLLWVPATILSSVAMSHYPGFVTQSPITELNLAVSTVGIRASSRPPTPPAYYYFPANHRHTIPAPARAKLVRKASYPRRQENVPPVPPIPYPHPDSLGIMLPIPEPLPPLPELATTPTPLPVIKVTPATAPACLCPGNGRLVPPAPNTDKPCPPPPGTAWAKDWEQLAVDAGVSRNASLSTVGTATLDGRVDAYRAALRAPLPQIVVTHSPEPV
ncbi:uncharacterized protein ColSpa_12317 [Colletotrichum spaethianum]|uniref:Uncharacterized protein n=1 Tax=Colletotrichum spaethianum TaxID=700344 RepID=A0AA37PGZ0_9PEZI|nr:uncharacterized protein ColSpa_12317 [Colletotrichum spaethianum]GKT52136.1 hypothetical protein ColSpa_12317 [Colletotrichum spaethianum]